MKERALMMGGTVEVSGEAGKGVTLIVSVPMSAAEKT
jgi:signal transduction histidine kinase